MKANSRYFLMGTSLLGAFIAMLMSSAAFAVVNIPYWCAEIQVQYTDSSGVTTKEDILYSTDVQEPAAQYMEAAVFYKNGAAWEEVKRGYISQYISQGGSYYYCFDQSISVNQGGRYRFRLYTRLKYGNRMVMVMKDESTWAAPNRFYVDQDYVIPTSWEDGTHNLEQPFTFGPTHKNLSAAGIMRRVLQLSSLLSYPEATSEDPSRNIELYINQQKSAPGDDGDGCNISKVAAVDISTTGTLKIPLCAPPYGGNGAAAIEKFQLAHEVGHAFQIMRGGTGFPVPVSQLADLTGADISPIFGAGAICQCPTGPSHCIQSREYIGVAIGEAFATFIGTAFFNYQSYPDSSGWFNYYKHVDPSLDTAHVPATGEPPVYFDWNSSLDVQNEWMRDNCIPNGAAVGGLGAELDWVRFFWQGWSVPTTGQMSKSDFDSVLKNTNQTALCCLKTPPPAVTISCLAPGAGGTCTQGRTLTGFGMMWGSATGHPAGLDYLVTTAQELVSTPDSNFSSDNYERFTSLGEDLGLNGLPN